MVSSKQSSRSRTIVLIIVVILLAVIPLLIIQGSEFGGADGAAETAITEINPTYEPWFEPIWSPPGGETESLLFALQAALGASVIGYYFGLKRGKQQADAPPPQHKRAR